MRLEARRVRAQRGGGGKKRGTQSGENKHNENILNDDKGRNKETMQEVIKRRKEKQKVKG